MWHRCPAVLLKQPSKSREVSKQGAFLKPRFNRPSLERSWQQIQRYSVQFCIGCFSGAIFVQQKVWKCERYDRHPSRPEFNWHWQTWKRESTENFGTLHSVLSEQLLSCVLYGAMLSFIHTKRILPKTTIDNFCRSRNVSALWSHCDKHHHWFQEISRKQNYQRHCLQWKGWKGKSWRNNSGALLWFVIFH